MQLREFNLDFDSLQLVNVLEEWMVPMSTVVEVEKCVEVVSLLDEVPFGAASDGWSIASRGNHKSD